MIAADGPISVERFMTLALQHPRYGYYRTKLPIGAAGDFITAPEIHQMFGELIGLWAVEVWHQMGEPAPFRLIELGPGRGTLMADMLRAARLRPAFLQAADIHLVEASEALIDVQRASLDEYACDMAPIDRRLCPTGRRSSSPTNSSMRCRSANMC